MRRLLATVSVFAFVTSSAVLASPFNNPRDVKQITAIEQAVAAETDLDKLMSYYTPDAVVADFAAPGWYEGAPAIRTAVGPILAPMKGVRFHMNEFEIASDGKLACAVMQTHFDVQMKDGSTFSATIDELDALKKLDGQWKVLFQELSLPIDPKTGMAVFNAPLAVHPKLRWAKDPLPGPAVARDAALAQIRAWLDVEGTETNLDRVVSLYGPTDDDILFEPFLPVEHRGLKEIRAYIKNALVGVKSVDMKLAEYHADSDGLMAVQLDRQTLTVHMADGSTQVMWFRQSDCLRHVGDKWHTFLELGSAPVDMKTGKAVLANPVAPAN